MMKSKAKRDKILAIIAAAFLAIFALFTPIQAIARAEDLPTVQNLDTTQVDTDLSDISAAKMAGITAKNSVQLIRFQEYCYSAEYPIYDGYYGLYVYVYTPDGDKKPLATEYNQNKVNMAIANIGTSAPDYKNMPLQYLGTSEIYQNKIHKLKVLFSEQEKVTFLSEVRKYANANKGVRRYDVVSFQLTHKDGTKTDTSELNATDKLTTNDRLFSKTLYFSGYAAGMSAETSGENATSTLTCKYDELETIELEIKHANYRDLNSFNAENITDSLDFVYFNVPETYFTDYGRLQKIEAEWYEYKTKPIFVTSDAEAHTALQKYVGKDIGTEIDKDSLSWRVLWEGSSPFAGSSYKFNKYYGYYGEGSQLGTLNTVHYYWSEAQNLPEINWLFLRTGVKSNKDYKVTSDEVKQWALAYGKTYGTAGYVNYKYAKELFEDSIDADRIEGLENPNAKRGYMHVNIDADAVDDKVNLAEKQKPDFSWDDFWNGPRFETKTYDPIIVITGKEMSGLDTTSFAEKYLIGETYAEEVFENCKKCIEKGERFILFRFAVTDYYASTARFDKDGNGMSDQDGYVAQETVFMDFDVISLTFRNTASQTDTVIGVCASPIDIFNGLQAPPNLGTNNDKNKAALIASLIIIILLFAALFIIGIYFPGVGQLMLTAVNGAARGIGAGLKFAGTWFVAKPFEAIKNGIEALLDGKNKGNKGGGKKKR